MLCRANLLFLNVTVILTIGPARAAAQFPWTAPRGADDRSSAALGRGSFRVLPVSSSCCPASLYPVCPDPNAGYLSGGADVINVQTPFVIGKKQDDVMGEQLRQTKIDARRRNVDEYLYERNVPRAPEDERERLRVEKVRRTRNGPPAPEIWSAKALNQLLLSIQQQHALKVLGPDVPITQEVLRHVNLTGGSASGNIAVLRDEGRLQWPAVLEADDFAAERESLERLARQAYQQAAGGSVAEDTLQALNEAVGKLEGSLKRAVNEVTPEDYMQAKRYVRELRGAVKALRNPDVASQVTRKWASRGNSVTDLVKLMTRDGLKFAPAIQGDEEAYVTLHRALTDYFDAPPSARRWDTSPTK
jgi:hypothetical protein